MPIKPIVLQRRHAELGRIRLGYKADTSNGGTRPAKLETFRFTSVSERYIRDLAQLYGGEARPWDNGGISSWEVYTEAKSVPVIAVKGGLSQWMEYWSGGGCIHRCDGETNVLTGELCDLDERITIRVRGKDVQINPHTEARPTTRLSLMLPELEAIGVWRCETHGWNAAAEIPAVAELAQYVGDLVPAHLHLVERRAIKDGQTSRFVVPVLDLQIGTARLREIVAEKMGQPAELGGGPKPAAIAAPDPYLPYFARVHQAGSLDALAQVWTEMVAAHLLGKEAPASQRADEFGAAWKARAAELKTATTEPDAPASEQGEADAPAPTSPAPDADGVYEAQVVEDADAVWAQIMQIAASRGLTRTPDLEQDCSTFLNISSAEATAEELGMYLTELRNRPETAA